VSAALAGTGAEVPTSAAANTIASDTAIAACELRRAAVIEPTFVSFASGLRDVDRR
jgi:hypothetical protein